MTSAAAGSLSPQALSELRHELRTPINQIVGYCEMLLEDADAAQHAARRTALADALAAVKSALAEIDRTLPAGRSDVRPQDAETLHNTLRSPRDQILKATEALLADPDHAFVTDVRKIRSAAERLGMGVSGVGGRVSGASHPAAQADTVAPVDVGPRQPTPDTRHLILVVDDIEDNRDVLRRRLERQGHAVECAASGADALALAGSRSFDLVLLDVMMPGLDGYAVLERLKASPETRDVPVIMISALDDIASVVRCIERGAEDYLPKPFDPVLLKARIGACLEKKRLRDREKAYLRDVERVIGAARAVERGAYQAGSLADLAARADEVGRLARVFDGMAEGVKEREARLEHQLDDLRQEIQAASAAGADEAGAGEPELRTGDWFAGRYEILGTIGAGGMGVVYRAKDGELGEVVAIKMLRPDILRGDDTAIQRLKAETRLARRISHRNVVRTHDFGEHDGACYVTMEYVEGMTVRRLIDTRGRLSVSSALAIAAQLSDALDVAHRQGVVHRDIKPQNLLLDPDGVLKVMDFGVARLVEHTTVLTQVGMVVGTPSYMSPEQLLAEDVDGRSDLYSVGVVLYECLTGRLPFEARTPVSLIAKLLHDQPAPPDTINPDIPSALSALIMRLLAKSAAERPGDAAELKELLAHAG